MKEHKDCLCRDCIRKKLFPKLDREARIWGSCYPIHADIIRKFTDKIKLEINLT